MLTVAVLIVCQSSLGKISWYSARSMLRDGVWVIWFTGRGLANVPAGIVRSLVGWSPGHWERWARPLHRRNLYRKGKVNITFYVIYVGSALEQRPSLTRTCLLLWPCLVFCHSKGDIRLCPGVLHTHFQCTCNGRWGPCCGTAPRGQSWGRIANSNVCNTILCLFSFLACFHPLSASLLPEKKWRKFKSL